MIRSVNKSYLVAGQSKVLRMSLITMQQLVALASKWFLHCGVMYTVALPLSPRQNTKWSWCCSHFILITGWPCHDVL